MLLLRIGCRHSATDWRIAPLLAAAIVAGSSAARAEPESFLESELRAATAKPPTAQTGTASAPVASVAESDPAPAKTKQIAARSAEPTQPEAKPVAGRATASLPQAPMTEPVSVPPLIPRAKPDREETAKPAKSITIFVAGDTGFGASNASVSPTMVVRHGRRVTFAQMSADIRGLVNADINFANLETVITRSNKLRRLPKAFNFRTHPAGIAHLKAVGFNLFSLANNHAVDYGRAGMEASLDEMAKLADKSVHAYAGLGRNLNDALTPRRFKVKGVQFAFSAIGIGSGNKGSSLRPGPDRTGQLAYRYDKDYRDLVTRLAAASSAYRILSIHTGTERQVTPNASDVTNFRDIAIRANGIDLVIGHHAHVGQGMQIVDGKLIFYGLGNFMHPGMANMAGKGRCRDYGLTAKVHLLHRDGAKPQLAAVEVFPLTEMHIGPRVMRPERARDRVAVLNGLARRLDHDETGATGVRFHERSDGTGLHCTALGAQLSGEIGRLCRTLGIPTSENTRALGCSGPTPSVYVASNKQRRSRKRRRAGKTQTARGPKAWRRRAFAFD